MKADSTTNTRVVVKGFLRCLSFGRRIFIWVSVWLATCISMFFGVACENIYELMYLVVFIGDMAMFQCMICAW